MNARRRNGQALEAKRAFVVMGVPSSGTRLMARILIAAGCVGDGDHAQRWDAKPPNAEPLIVIRRHQPTGRPPAWASQPNIMLELSARGYAVTGIIIARDWHSTIQSMIAAPHVRSQEAGLKLAQSAWRAIFRNLPDDCPFEVVPYEAIVARPDQWLPAFYARHGLEAAMSLERIKDRNARYYAR